MQEKNLRKTLQLTISLLRHLRFPQGGIDAFGRFRDLKLVYRTSLVVDVRQGKITVPLHLFMLVWERSY